MTKKGEPTDFEGFLTWEALTSILSYDPATGEFRWIGARRLGWNNRVAGSTYQGYVRIEILGRCFQSQRLAWLYMTKRWPSGLVDHKNGNCGDNRWVNLRDVSRIENRRNWAPYQVVPIRKDVVVPPPVLREAKKAPRRGIASDFESFLTQEVVVSLLSYDPASGEFVWRDNRTNPMRIKIGQRAGSLHAKSGYINVAILGRTFRAHRIAWLYMTGKWPKADVDHKNGERSDNRWFNLRDATRSQNAFNQRRSKPNKSGIRGVYPHGKKWRVIVGLNNELVRLGTFSTKEEAEKVRRDFEQKHYAEFASNQPTKIGA